jgi:hypothetical protein
MAVDNQGDTIVAAWATYDSDGSPTWFTLQTRHWSALKPQLADALTTPGVFLGTGYRMNGPALGTAPLDSIAVKATPIGDIIFWTPPDQGFGGFGVQGAVTLSKAIMPLKFAAPVPACVEGAAPGPALNVQGTWWNPAEPGWALHLTHQGDVVFAVWFTYDVSGKATWLTMTAPETSAGSFGGVLYRTTAPPYTSGMYHSVPITYTEVGTATLMFADRNGGRFAFSVNGRAQTSDISRFTFAAIPTVCN